MAGSPDNLLTPGMFVEPDPSNPMAPQVLGGQALTRGAANLLWRAGKGVAGDVWDWVKAPGQIASGEAVQRGSPWANQLGAPEVDPTSYALQTAGYGMGTGAAMPAPAGSVGMFAGTRAGERLGKIIPKDRNVPIEGSGTLADAMSMQMLGHDRDAVFDKTGWFQGADSKWRFNISDEGAKLKMGNLDRLSTAGTDPDKDWFGPKRLPIRYNNKTGYIETDTQKVGDILDHPALFEAYPDLADIPLHSQSIGDIGYSLGAYDSKSNAMTLAKQPQEGLKSTLLHELQHAVQAREDFARGGNPSEFLHPTYDKDLNDILREKDVQEKQFTAMGIPPGDIQRYHGFGYYDRPIHTGFKPEEIDAVKSLPQDMVDRYKENWDLHKLYQQEQQNAVKHYLSLAGESEARATQAQNAAGIWDEAPWRMPDYRGMDYKGGPIFEPHIPFENQIVWPQSRPIARGSAWPYKPPGTP